MKTDVSKSPRAADGKTADRLIRVAVIGCGAVARQFHLPVLAGHEQVVLTALVDRNLDSARELAFSYGVPVALDDARQLDAEQVDGVIVATPPSHHASCALDLMERGFHVLVEKPMATCYQDAEAMVQAAERAGVALSVSLFRRLLPSLRMLRAAVAAEYLGRPLRFDLEGGAIYGWQAATLGNMRKELAGGGVLMDMGPHYFDELLAVFDGPGEVLGYWDDSRGGIEADCTVQLRLQHRGQSIDGCLTLSRLRNLRNSIVVECERGTLEMGGSDRFRIRVRPNGLELNDPMTSEPRPFELGLGWSDETETSWFETFRAEIDDWLSAIRERTTPRLSGRSALASMRLIDACYRQVQPLQEPWLDHPLRTPQPLPAEISVAAAVSPSRRVLVTGATGFIGSRIAEILSRRAGYQVRALVHNPGNASRVARLAVEMVQGDISSAADVARAVQGCDTVIHCAIGTEYGNERRIHEVTVEGTRKLLDASLAADVKRFVHLSSIAVYGNEATGVFDETTPVCVSAGDSYGESKLAAERAVMHAHQRGLQTVIFRPGCVYGPYGMTFVARLIQYLVRGQLILQDSADTPSNTVYVDSVVEAIICGVEARDGIAGEVFTLADDDGMTWGEFYGFFAHALGATLRAENSPATDGTNGQPHARNGMLRSAARLLTSPEFKQFGKRILETDPVGRFPRWVLESSPRLDRWIRRALGSDKPLIYARPPSAGDWDCIRITPRRATVSAAKARRMLGYGPLISREQAMARTLEWIRHSRLTGG